MTKAYDFVYLPALKAKAGEFRALASLNPSTKRSILPLLDVLPPPIDWNAGRPSKTLEKHLDDICLKTSKCWGRELPVLIDMFDLQLADRTSDGSHPIRYFFARSRQAGLRAIPVTGLSDRDDSYNQAVKDVLTQTDGAAAIRLAVEDAALPSSTAPILSKRLTSLGAAPEQSMLLLDYRALDADGIVLGTQQALASLRTFQKLARWGATVLLASGMPRSLAGMSTGQGFEIRRAELDLWQNVTAGLSKDGPTFGDYGVVHAYFSEPRDLRKIPITMKIRYTLDHVWFVVRGGSFRKNSEQYHDLAGIVAAHSDYKGRDFSAGDDVIFKCQAKLRGPGNPTDWVQADTSHHIEFVSRQISSLLAA
jgi:hypothetical protein